MNDLSPKKINSSVLFTILHLVNGLRRFSKFKIWIAIFSNFGCKHCSFNSKLSLSIRHYLFGAQIPYYSEAKISLNVCEDCWPLLSQLRHSAVFLDYLAWFPEELCPAMVRKRRAFHTQDYIVCCEVRRVKATGSTSTKRRQSRS